MNLQFIMMGLWVVSQKLSNIMTKILILAGEVSGDLHASKLVEALLARDASLKFLGMGGDKLRALGVDVQVDVTSVSTIGFLEPILFLPRLARAFFKMKKLLKTVRPDVVIAVDYQGFNLALLKVAKKLGIPTVYFVSPQEWQWGTDAGGCGVLAVTDFILAIFRDEALFYERLGGRVNFVGHPLLDYTSGAMSRAEFGRVYQVRESDRIVALFAGSRPQELKLVYPILLEAALRCQCELGNVVIFVSVSAAAFRDAIVAELPTPLPDYIRLYDGSSYDLMSAADLSFAPSGTITLEHAIMGKPAVIGYRFNAVSFFLAKLLLGKRLKRIKYVSLPNILLDRRVMPEFFQDEFTVDNVMACGLSLLTDSKLYQKTSDDIKSVRALLGEEGVLSRASEAVLAFMKMKRNNGVHG